MLQGYQLGQWTVLNISCFPFKNFGKETVQCRGSYRTVLHCYRTAELYFIAGSFPIAVPLNWEPTVGKVLSKISSYYHNKKTCKKRPSKSYLSVILLPRHNCNRADVTSPQKLYSAAHRLQPTEIVQGSPQILGAAWTLTILKKYEGELLINLVIILLSSPPPSP